ncbi:MAG TPA: hypothetical protein VGQ99_11475 [Tepidisphaeraceae bacterium]|jgi:hypothetical protein|nr:hypothetical protein [Tepidisphaeraceae bacterium]
MALNKDEILAAAMALDPDDRRELAEDIFQSIDTDPLTRSSWRSCEVERRPSIAAKWR